MLTVEQIVDALAGRPGIELGPPAKGHDIEQMERSLGVRFPEEYKAFLARCGWLKVETDDLYGVAGGEDGPVGAVHRTEFEREWLPDLPHNAVVLRDLGNGDYWYLTWADSHGEAAKEGAVIQFHHELDEHEKISDSFRRWLLLLLREPDAFPFGPV